ncbi:hypothetical protein EZV62_020139 [Acer yangbiense]|uniref:SWIM-type domain-containing protein n=1 Tax=Acer yangbiense TaxID=1000413 RepID=A0A5C7HCM5_9ROSI|nr:hypothetical protein EZV62_020139 [Acer yangbiense]
MGLDIFDIYVTIDTEVVELGTCDADHISMIVLLHALSEKQTGSDQVPEDDYSVWVYLPWSSEKKEVCSDNDILDVFRLFTEHKQTQIMFEIEKRPYIPAPADLEASSNTPSRFMGDIPDVAFSAFEQDLFGNNEDQVRLGDDYGDDSGDDESPGMRAGDDSGDYGNALAVVPEVPEEVCEGTDDFEDLFEGYQSKTDDEYCSDEGEEISDDKLARVVKSNPFKQLVGCPIRFEVGQTHDSVYTLRSLLTDFAIQEGFNLNKVKNDKNRLTWACMAKGCPWRIHASNVGDDTTMQVKTYKSEHTCHRIYKSKEARSKWIAGKFQTLVKSNPGIQASVLSDLLRDQFNVTVDTQRLYKAKRRAIEVLLKEHEECFKHLRAYAVMVQQCNPGSAAYIHLLDKTSTFERMFVSFDAQRKGFLEGCRPFIGIDGCHLKGPYGGVLLSAIALDANSGLYPLAYCICEGETFLSWSWFLRHLRIFLRYPDEKPICFMSDKQKGVIGALKMQWPRASIRHAFDASIKCESVTNNMSEAFNSMLKDFRPRTYLQLMEFIRRLVMTRFQLRKEECNKWTTDIPPSVNKKILENSKESRILRTLHSGGGKYEMLGVGRAYTANLPEKTCECGQWQVSGVPCSHALAGIRHHFGVHDLCIWADLDTARVDAPPLKRLPGRPKLVRKRELGEKLKAAKTGTVVCGNCKLPGHNSRSCKSEKTSGTTKKNKVSNTTEADVSVSSSQTQPAATSSQSQSQPPTKRQRARKGKAAVGSSQPTEVLTQTQEKSQLTQDLNC